MSYALSLPWSRAYRCCLLVLCALSFLGFLPTSAGAWQLDQQWTRAVRPGVTFFHFRLTFEQGPAHLYMLQIDPGAYYTIRPVIANNRIGSLAQVDRLAREVQAVAAINGGFFDTRGQHLPVGLIRIDYRYLFEQFLPRPVLGIDAGGKIHFATFALHSSLYLPDAEVTIPLSGYNRARKFGQVVAYSREFGASTRTNPWGREIVLRRVSPGEPPAGTSNLLGLRYLVTGESAGDSVIPNDGLVLSFHSRALHEFRDQLSGLYPGAEIELRGNLPPGWEAFPHLLGGGPMLLKDGAVVLDYATERFKARMNHPASRTAVGLTSAGKIALIVIDRGEPAYSVGATWDQLALVGRDFLGLSELMGFDGGGSSTMFIEDRVVNRPSSGTPRAVANILAVVPLR